MVLMAIGLNKKGIHYTENPFIAGYQRHPQDLRDEVSVDILAAMSVRIESDDNL